MIKKALIKLLNLLIRHCPAKLLAPVLQSISANPQLTDQAGFSVRNIHFYETIPDFRIISKEKLLRPRKNPAITWNEDFQIQMMNEISIKSQEINQYFNSNLNILRNFSYSKIDAAIYYGMIRHLNPATVLEIGCGFSTKIALDALKMNSQEGHHGEMKCIEPYPSDFLLELKDQIILIDQKIEELDLSLFESLQKGDFLFIDSTHTVKCQSDVLYCFYEILPILRSGVWIHIHHIFLPYDYPSEWILKQRRTWNEQYFFETFLMNNKDYSVVCGNNFLLHYHPAVFEKFDFIKEHDKKHTHSAGGFWICKN